MDKISKAKADLILDQPFFASLLLTMPLIKDNRVPTAGTDGKKILYNEKFFESLTVKQTVFVLAHEVMHCVFQHMFRRGKKNPKKYNFAGDYIINDILKKESVGELIEHCLYDEKLVIDGKGTTEGVYDLLPDDFDKNGKGEEKGSGLGEDILDPEGTEAEQAQAEAEMKIKIIQAANAARMAGKLSANLERFVKGLVKSRVDWKHVLRRFLSERAKVDLSYAKPKRRFLADDVYLPSLTGEKMGSIVIPVDCSGSINEEMLLKFSTEINAIVKDVKPAAVHVLYFDTEILRHDTFTPDQDIEIKPVGGGGTAFSPIFKYIDEKCLNPTACVVLTDLCCSDFGGAPEYPVLWASTYEGEAPWGEVLSIRD